MNKRATICWLLTIASCVVMTSCEFLLTRTPYPNHPTMGTEAFDYERVFARYPHLRGVVLSAPEYMEELEMLKATGQLEEAVPEYVLVTGVSISIEVLDEPLLTRTVIVGPDGKVDLPYIGEVRAAGLTISQFKATITERLRRYIKEPQVIINITDPTPGLVAAYHAAFVGQVNVLGRVNRPGPVGIRGGENIADVISAAGDLATDAEWRQIHVIKKAKDISRSRVVIVDWMAFLREKDFRQLIPIHQGDIIFVPLHVSWGEKFERDWDLILKYLTGAVSYDASIEALREE